MSAPGGGPCCATRDVVVSGQPLLLLVHALVVELLEGRRASASHGGALEASNRRRRRRSAELGGGVTFRGPSRLLKRVGHCFCINGGCSRWHRGQGDAAAEAAGIAAAAVSAPAERLPRSTARGERAVMLRT